MFYNTPIDNSGQACYRFHTMRMLTLALSLLLLTLACPHIAAQTAPQQTATFGSLDITADVIESRPVTQDFQATGAVHATYDGSELFADSIKGNARSLEVFATQARARVDSLRIQGEELTTRRIALPGTAAGYSLEYIIRNGLFTTCDLERADYKVTARQITIRPNQNAVARKVSLWLGGVKLITLPKLSVGLGRGRQRESFLPTPGYSEQDGPYIAFNYGLVNTDMTDVALRLRATTRQSLQGGVRAERALAGPLEFNTTAALDLGLRPLLLPTFQPPAETCPVFPQPNAFRAQTLAFGSLLHRQRTFDIDSEDLRLTAFPKVGVRWISSPVHLLPSGSISVYGAAEASWGRFKEEDGVNVSGPRADLRLSLSALPLQIPGGLFFQPAVNYRESRYEGPDRYRTFGTSADLTRVFGRSYVSARFISYAVNGVTPFEFDDIDRARELQGAFQYCGAQQGFRLVLRYGLDQTGLYDWEASYSRKLHCIVPTFTWRNRFGLFDLDVRVLGLN